MITYLDYHDREEWLAGRKKSLGCSEVAAAIGMSHFQSALELWKIKTGKQAAKDLSDNARVEYGTNAEAPLRELFTLKHKDEYEVLYHPYRIYKNDLYDGLHATLDGELIRLSDGAKGVWECKTAMLLSKAAEADWADNSIPTTYYVQVLAQAAIMEADFVILNAELRFSDGHAEIREYPIEIDDEQVQQDTQFILSETKKFWQYVLDGKEPPMKISL